MKCRLYRYGANAIVQQDVGEVDVDVHDYPDLIIHEGAFYRRVGLEYERCESVVNTLTPKKRTRERGVEHDLPTVPFTASPAPVDDDADEG